MKKVQLAKKSNKIELFLSIMKQVKTFWNMFYINKSKKYKTNIFCPGTKNKLGCSDASANKSTTTTKK